MLWEQGILIYSGDENSAHLRQEVGGYYEKRRRPSGAVETLCGWIWVMTCVAQEVLSINFGCLHLIVCNL